MKKYQFLRSLTFSMGLLASHPLSSATDLPCANDSCIQEHETEEQRDEKITYQLTADYMRLNPFLLRYKTPEDYLTALKSQKRTNSKHLVPTVTIDLRNQDKTEKETIKKIEIPSSIGPLIHLESLICKFSEQTLFPLKPRLIIPSEITRLTNLSTLEIVSFRVENITWIPYLTNLKKLEISNTRITDFPESIGRLTNLTDLCIRERNITYLPLSMVNLTALTIIVVTQTPFQPTEVFDRFINRNNAIEKEGLLDFMTFYKKKKKMLCEKYVIFKNYLIHTKLDIPLKIVWTIFAPLYQQGNFIQKQ